MIGIVVSLGGAGALDRLQRLSQTLPVAFQNRLVKLVTAASLRVERQAKREVPVDTGTLRSSITTEVREVINTVEGRIGTNVKYGPYVEYGTGLFGPKKQRIYPTSAKALSWIPKTRGGYVTAKTSGRRYYKRGKSMGEGNRVTVRSIRGMHPHPYLIPAIENVLPQFQADLAKLAEPEFWSRALNGSTQ